MLQSHLTSSSTGQGIDEEDAAGQGSGTSSSRTELYFCKPQPLDDLHYSMPPPQLATWEYNNEPQLAPYKRWARSTTA